MIATMDDGEREDRRPLPYDLLHSIAKEVVGAQSEELDAAIQSSLARIGEHFGVATVGLGGLPARPCCYSVRPERARVSSLGGSTR